MSATSGPNIVENGLVFCVDPGDSRSLVGEPTTNLLNNPTPLSVSEYTATGGTGSISYDPTTSSLIWQRNTYETWGAFLNNNTLFNGTLNTSAQYTASFEWKQMGSISDASTSFQIVQANGISPAASVNMIANSVEIENGFYRFSYTFTPTNSGIDAYFRVVNPSTTGTNIFYWRKLQLEQKSYRSTFTIGTRNTMSDISGFNNIGTLSNIPLFNSSQNGSLLFNSASSQQITFQNTSTLQFLNTANYTLESWVYPTANPGSNNWTGILDRESNLGSGRDGYNLYMNGSVAPDTNVYFGCERWFSGTGVFPSITVSNSDALNKWQLLTYTYDGTNVRLYRNAVLGATATSTGNITNNSKALTIGVRGGQFFTGRISNTKIYNRALSATEVKQNFDALRRRFGV